jgi:predicted nuclease of predicted toxin-antitoxin system
MIIKDSDFIELITHLDPHPQLLWVNWSKASNEQLRVMFGEPFGKALAKQIAGQAIVKVG